MKVKVYNKGEKLKFEEIYVLSLLGVYYEWREEFCYLLRVRLTPAMNSTLLMTLS